MTATIEDRNALIEDHMDLAERIAKNQYKRMSVRSVQLDELKSAAYMGLVDAATKYQGGQFDTFASYRIYGEIKDYLRSLCWGTRSNRLNRFTLDEEYDTPVNSAETTDSVDVLVEGLTERSRDVVLMYYVEDYTLSDIASRLGVSQTRVHQILTQSVSKLRDCWQGRESEFCDD